MSARLRLQHGGITFTVAAHGAEPQSLIGPDGHEYLWQAGPAWPRHAPVLFPAICRHPGDSITVEGRHYPLGHHGFARDLDFTVTDQHRDRATLTLESSEQTRRHYPYDFRLEITYQLEDNGVVTTFDVHNFSDRTLPFGLGSHPAFNWPLDAGGATEDHTVIFDSEEPAPARRTQDNLLLADRFTNTGIVDRQLELTPERFAHGAIILDTMRSSALRYRSPSGRAVHLSWEKFRELALWSPHDGDFLCIEPWRGLPALQDWCGEEHDRPDLEHLPPGETRRYSYRIGLETP
jgi:galactose mutarotase-like enzyme